MYIIFNFYVMKQMQQWAWSFKPQNWLRYRSESDQNFQYQILALDLGGDIRTKILRWISEQNLRLKDQAQCFASDIVEKT